MTEQAAQVEQSGVIHIIDDDRSIRDSLDSLFRSVGLTCRGYGSTSEFLESDERSGAGCLILDVRLPGMSGLDFQAQLARQHVNLPVVLMTGHGDIPMGVQAMKAGAVDFLAKPFRDQDMLDAVASALERDRERRRADGLVAELRSRHDSLSSRERQVMALVVTGKMNKQIAWELEVSEITVKIHRGAAMRKMQARSLAELVRMAETLNSA